MTAQSSLPTTFTGLYRNGTIDKGWIAKLRPASVVLYLAICNITETFTTRSRRASLTTMSELTGLSKFGIRKAADQLEEYNLIQRHKDGGVILWQLISNNVVLESCNNVAQLDNSVAQKSNYVAHKDNIVARDLSLNTYNNNTNDEPDLDEIFPGPKASEIMPVTTDADSHQLHVDADQHNPLSPVDDIARHWYAGVSKNPSQPLPQDKRKRKKWVKHAGAILAEVGGDVEGLLHAIDHFYFDMQSGDTWTRDNVTEPRNDKLQTAIIAHYNVLEDRRRSYANNGAEDYDLDAPTPEGILFSQVLAFCKTRWPVAYNDLFAPWELIELNGACRVSVPANVKMIFEQRPNMAGVLPEIESEFDMSIELVGE